MWPPSIPLLVDACQPSRYDQVTAIAERLGDAHAALIERAKAHGTVPTGQGCSRGTGPPAPAICRSPSSTSTYSTAARASPARDRRTLCPRYVARMVVRVPRVFCAITVRRRRWSRCALAARSRASLSASPALPMVTVRLETPRRSLIVSRRPERTERLDASPPSRIRPQHDDGGRRSSARWAARP